MKGIDIGEPDICLIKYITCLNCGFSYIKEIDDTHNYDEIDGNICIDCGFKCEHTYEYYWIPISEEEICGGYIRICLKCGTYNIFPIYGHSFTDENDKTCNYCQYSCEHKIYWDLVYVGSSEVCEKWVVKCYDCGNSWDKSYLPHQYSGCEDSTCDICYYMRTNTGHSFRYEWVKVATADICQKYVKTCEVCGYSVVVTYDYTHNYTDCFDNMCDDCYFQREGEDHSYTYEWKYDESNENLCRKYVARCTKCGYSYVASYDYTHNYTDCVDRAV